MGLFGCSGTTLAKQGTCGENLVWKYNSWTRTLTISGTGDMDAVKYRWKDYNIKTLVLKEGITSICDSAFAWQEKLTGELVLPSTLKSIGSFAFYGCGFTGDLIIPDGVERIEDYTFCNCAGFDGVLHLPENCTYIGIEAFNGCSGLTGALNIPDTVEEIGRVAFNKCSGFTGDLIIPDSVTKIGDFCFAQCEGLNGILQLSNNLKEIAGNAFAHCQNLTGDLVIPDGVTVIGYNAFSGCYSLDGCIVLPDTVTEIGEYAFANCEKLTGTLHIPSGIRIIEDDTFHGCKAIDSIEFNEGLEYISHEAFCNCTGLTELTFPSTLRVIGSRAFNWCTSLGGDIAFPKGLTDIDREAFYGCKALNGGVTLPSTLLNIGEEAFSGCGLTGTLEVPVNVVNIGAYAFMDCNFDAVVFTDGIRTVGEGAFRGCIGLKSVTFGSVIPDYFDASQARVREFGGEKTSEFTATFPEGCVISSADGAVRVRDTWEALKSEAEAEARTQASQAGDAGAQAKDTPWYWTDALSDSYYGIGIVGGCTLEFADGIAYVYVNGDAFASSEFNADANDATRSVSTDILCLRDGRLVNLGLATSVSAITGELVGADGTSRTVYFISGSAEDVYK